MCATIRIGKTKVGEGQKPYIIAELSGNHEQDLGKAKALILAAKEAGADAAKIQTYTADTLTLDARNDYFQIQNEGLWGGMYFHELYSQGSLPWEWHEILAAYAEEVGIDFFSSPFDESAVYFLEKTLNPPIYKVGSHELTNLPLLEAIGSTHKPIIMSTGMGTEAEIQQALDVIYRAGTKDIILLKCITNYPADPNTFNLRSMPYMKERFNCLVGLSDHTITDHIAVASVALGACVIEKHLQLGEDQATSIDQGFSLTPKMFSQMVDAVRTTYRALGEASLGVTEQEVHELRSRRSIFIAAEIKKGELLTRDNLKIVRPADGLSPSYWKRVLGKRATQDLVYAQPLKEGDWE